MPAVCSGDSAFMAAWSDVTAAAAASALATCAWSCCTFTVSACASNGCRLAVSQACAGSAAAVSAPRSSLVFGSKRRRANDSSWSASARTMTWPPPPVRGRDGVGVSSVSTATPSLSNRAWRAGLFTVTVVRKRPEGAGASTPCPLVSWFPCFPATASGWRRSDNNTTREINLKAERWDMTHLFGQGRPGLGGKQAGLGRVGVRGGCTGVGVRDHDAGRMFARRAWAGRSFATASAHVGR